MKRKLCAVLIIALILAAARHVDSPLPVLMSVEPPFAALASVHFIDVGQGDATLILSGGLTVLIDGGDVWAGPRLLGYLHGLGILHLDYVIASGTRPGHIGALPHVLSTLDVDTLLAPAALRPTPEYAEVIQTAARREISLVTPRAGQKYPLGQGVTLEILAPADSLAETTGPGVAATVVSRLVAGQITFLFAGDMDQPTESRLMRKGAVVRSDVLKVALHGSRVASSALFLDRVAPSTAVISVGAYNEMGLPHPETLRRLESICQRVWRTDRHGTIVMVTDGRALSVRPERQPGRSGS